MARLRFRKPIFSILISEVISLAIWLFLGDRVIDVLDTLVGNTYTNFNYSGVNTLQTVEGCTNGTIFDDAFEILGIGYDCSGYSAAVTTNTQSLSNADNGLLGVIGLVMVVMILMNFVTYR